MASSAAQKKAAAKIHQACAEGDECMVISLTTKSCCWTLPKVVEARDPKTEATPLMTAAVRGDEGIGRILLSRGASVQAVDYMGLTALHHAAIHARHAKFVELLVNSGAHIESRTEDGLTPLLIGIVQGPNRQVDPLAYLLDQGADATATTSDGHGAFLLAVLYHRTAFIKVLLNKGLVVNVDQDRDAQGRTGFVLAVLSNDVATASMLLENGADINALDVENATVLQRIVENGNHEMAAYLLEQEAVDLTVRQQGTGATPLLLAAMLGDVEMVKMLLAKGADEEAKDDNEYTAARHATEQGHTDIAQLLLVTHERKAAATTAAATALAAAPAATPSVTTDASPPQRGLSWSEKNRTSSISSHTTTTRTTTAVEQAAEEQPDEEAAAIPPPAPVVTPSTKPATTPFKATMDVAVSNAPLSTRVRSAVPPLLPTKPEIRKEKTDPRSPSILVHFAPPASVPGAPRMGPLKYMAEAYLVPSPDSEGGVISVEESKGEANGRMPQDEKPVAVLQGLNSIQTPFVFQGLERSRWYLFKVYSESASTGMSAPSVTEPIFLATAPNTAPPVTEIAAVEVDGIVEEEGKGTVRVTMDIPADDGGSFITSYVLNAKPGALKFESADKVMLLPGLIKGKSYKISVSARNAVGQGPFSKVLDFDFNV